MTEEIELEDTTVKDALNNAINNLRAAVDIKMESGDWDGTLPHFRRAHDLIGTIITTLEEQQEEAEE